MKRKQPTVTELSAFIGEDEFKQVYLFEQFTQETIKLSELYEHDSPKSDKRYLLHYKIKEIKSEDNRIYWIL